MRAIISFSRRTVLHRVSLSRLFTGNIIEDNEKYTLVEIIPQETRDFHGNKTSAQLFVHHKSHSIKTTLNRYNVNHINNWSQMFHLSSCRVESPPPLTGVQTGRFQWGERMFVVRAVCEGGSRGWCVSASATLWRAPSRHAPPQDYSHVSSSEVRNFHCVVLKLLRGKHKDW
jgi:hypothetical protein